MYLPTNLPTYYVSLMICSSHQLASDLKWSAVAVVFDRGRRPPAMTLHRQMSFFLSPRLSLSIFAHVLYLLRFCLLPL